MTILTFVLMLAAVAPVAKTQTIETVLPSGSNISVSQVCEAPKLVRKQPTAKKVSAPLVKEQVAAIPAVGWPDSVVWSLAGAVVLLGLIVAFLLGRVTTTAAVQPQVVAPVVYVQPPPPPPLIHRP